MEAKKCWENVKYYHVVTRLYSTQMVKILRVFRYIAGIAAYALGVAIKFSVSNKFEK